MIVFSRKIGFKLILIVGLAAVLSIGIFAFFNIRSVRHGLEAEVERHANQLSETVKYSTRYDMLYNQRDRIHQVITNIGEQASISRIRVLNKSGEIMYSSKKEDIGRMLDKREESCYACHAADEPLQRLTISERTRVYRVHPDSTRILGIINPIYNEPACWQSECHAHNKYQTVLGVLDVTMSLAEVDQSIRWMERDMVVFALCAFVAVSLITGYFVKKWVDVPVRELLTATQEVAAGNMSYTIKNRGKDELGQLAGSFNHMTAKLAEARMQLFQSDKMASLGRLAAGVAHEINNPLTGVLTYSSFLLKRTRNQPEMQEDLKVIVRETLRSREIVKSLLDFARQSVPKKSEADIHDIIDRSLAVVENQMAIHRIHVRKSYDSSLPRITVDSNQIQQVFINLLVNAVDAMGDQGGEISISTSLLTLSPVGTMQIKRAQCPKRHNLMDAEFKVAGLPSVKLRVKQEGREGFWFLDPVYGSFRHQHSIPLNDSTPIAVSCPECGISLIDEGQKCPVCRSPILRFEVAGKGMFESCTRRRCEWQQWRLVDESGHRNYVDVRIQDTGSGIPREDLPRIFEPFFSTKGQRGTGLGLSVIWGIVDNHNGKISVESEPGKGTLFTIRLPEKDIL